MDLTKIDPKFVMELATGMEPGEAIALRYGYSLDDWEFIKSSEGIQRQVASLTAEMKISGVTFARKAAMIAEDLLADLFVLAKKSKSPAEVLSIAQFAAKMGRLEPVAADNKAGGGAVFELTFNFKGKAETPLVIDMPERIPQELLKRLNADLDYTEYTDEAIQQTDTATSA
jgi:hypothetical protein